MQLIYSSSLAHHGIKGMHWGIRRYQNADGSLTSAGRNRYEVGRSIVSRKEKVLSPYAKGGPKPRSHNDQILQENPRVSKSVEKRKEQRKKDIEKLEKGVALSKQLLKEKGKAGSYYRYHEKNIESLNKSINQIKNTPINQISPSEATKKVTNRFLATTIGATVLGTAGIVAGLATKTITPETAAKIQIGTLALSPIIGSISSMQKESSFRKKGIDPLYTNAK